MRKLLVGLGFPIIILMLVFIGFKMGEMAGKNAPKPETKKDTEVKEKTPVLVQEVKLQDIPLTIKGEGRVNAAKMIKVTSEVQGKVISGNLKMGTNVRKGQLIYSVDKGEYALSIKARRSSFITLLAGILPDIKMDYASSASKWLSFYTAINPDDNLPQLPAINSTQEKTFIASKGVLAEYYNIKSMEEKLKKYYFYAPFSGSIMASYTEKGAIVNPGSPIVDLIQNGQLEVEIPVSNESAKLIKSGAKVKLWDKKTDKQYTGRVTRKGNFVNAATQSISIYVQVIGNNDLYNGMYLSAEFPSGIAKDVFVFPKQAIVDNNHLFTVKDSMIFKQQIDILNEENNQVYVKGIPNGSIVVNEAVTNGKDSMEVIPVIKSIN